MATEDQMHEVMAGHVERGELPGLATLIGRRGQVHVDVIGRKAMGTSDPMRRDTIFRISSMTKPITAAAAMILLEEGRLRLDEPVDALLPELAHRRVLKRLDGPLDDTVPAKRPIATCSPSAWDSESSGGRRTRIRSRGRRTSCSSGRSGRRGRSCRRRRTSG
jgi:CubicO group peptidase (beta-lactamase class C family)